MGGGEGQTLMATLRDFPMSGEKLRYGASSACFRHKWLPSEGRLEEEAGLRDLSLHLIAHAGNGVVYCRLAQTANLSREKLLSFVDWLRILAKQLGGYVVVEAIT